MSINEDQEEITTITRFGTNCIICGTCIRDRVSPSLAVGAVLTYYILAIKFLVANFYDAMECNIYLWIYVLISILLSFIRLCLFKSSDSNDDKETPYICIGLIDAGLAAWGGVELWEKSCVPLKETNLWDIGFTTFIIQASSAGICLFVIPMSICCIAKKSGTYNVREGESVIV